MRTLLLNLILSLCRSTDCLGYTPRGADFDTHHNILWRSGRHTWWRNKLQRNYWNWLVDEQYLSIYLIPFRDAVGFSFWYCLCRIDADHVSVNNELMSINLSSFCWHVFQVESQALAKRNWGTDCLVEVNCVICLVEFSTPMSSHTTEHTGFSLRLMCKFQLIMVA